MLYELNRGMDKPADGSISKLKTRGVYLLFFLHHFIILIIYIVTNIKVIFL
jgi:hypothetical protein